MARTKTNTREDTKTRTTSWRNSHVEFELIDTVVVEGVYATEVDTDAIDADVPRYCVDFTDVWNGVINGDIDPLSLVEKVTDAGSLVRIMEYPVSRRCVNTNTAYFIGMWV